MVEHSPEKAGVDSSILSLGTTPHYPFSVDYRPARNVRTSELALAGSFPFGKSREVECGDGHGRRNIEGFYVAAEGDGESSGGLSADLS